MRLLAEIFLFAGCFVSILGLAGPAQAGKHRSSGCTLRGSKTIVTTAQVRVFRRTTASAVSSYACSYRTGKRYLLARTDADYGYGESSYLETIAGNVVAYAEQQYDDSQRYNPDFKGFPDEVRALDTRTGRDRVALADGLSDSQVTDLVVAPDLSLAWIASSGGSYIVRKDVAAGTGPIDFSKDVDPHSLAIGGSWLYWVKGGVVKGQPLAVGFSA